MLDPTRLSRVGSNQDHAMNKLICAVVCLLALLSLGCKKAGPAENPNARLQGPSADQMRNTYSRPGGPAGGGGRPVGAPYGMQGGMQGAPYGRR
jgi:hypothetical protein